MGIPHRGRCIIYTCSVGPCAQARPGVLRTLASFALPAGLVTLGSWLSARRSVSENATRRVAASRSVRRLRGPSGPLRSAFFHLIGLTLMQLNPTRSSIQAFCAVRPIDRRESLRFSGEDLLSSKQSPESGKPHLVPQTRMVTGAPRAVHATGINVKTR